jgi:hypothetical protein
VLLPTPKLVDNPLPALSLQVLVHYICSCFQFLEAVSSVTDQRIHHGMATKDPFNMLLHGEEGVPQMMYTLYMVGEE